MRFKRTLAVTAATVGTLAAVGLPAASAHAADAVTSVTLPINQFSHMLVDPAHQHLFISGSGGDFTHSTATASTGIMVTDYSGQKITMIPDTGGASAMSISSDGSRASVRRPLPSTLRTTPLGPGEPLRYWRFHRAGN